MQMKTPAGRFAPIGRQDVDFTRRWVFPVDKDANQLIDTFDKLKTAIEPTSQYSDVAAAAVAREWDDRLIAAAFATAQIGTDAAGVLGRDLQHRLDRHRRRLPDPSTFGSAAASGLTVAKMIEAKRAFRKLQVPQDEPRPGSRTARARPICSIRCRWSRPSSTTARCSPTAQVTRFLGFDIVYSERLARRRPTCAEHPAREVGPLPRHLEGHREQRRSRAMTSRACPTRSTR
jgi:hypothetical protein